MGSHECSVGLFRISESEMCPAHQNDISEMSKIVGMCLKNLSTALDADYGSATRIEWFGPLFVLIFTSSTSQPT